MTAGLEPWVDAEAVAEYVSVERDWVYEHAAELGARRLGRGPRARLRFRLSLVDEALACVSTSVAGKGASSGKAPVHRLRVASPRRRSGSEVVLLPVREAR